MFALLRKAEDVAAGGTGPGESGGGRSSHEEVPRRDGGASSGVDRILLAPALGFYRGDLPKSAGIVPDQRIGTLTILGRVFPLLAPKGSAGSVIECSLPPGLHAVDYGQELYRLGAISGARAVEEEEGAAAAAGEVSARQIAVRSPTEGVFYRRPDPQSPAYVNVGDVVELGHPLGLVEVMKCFNQVRYAGHDLPPRARVAKILVEDSAEIRHDQVLFLLEGEG